MGNRVTILENRTWYNIEIRMWVDPSRPDKFKKIVRIKPGKYTRVDASTFSLDDDDHHLGDPDLGQVMLLVYANGSWTGKYILPQHLCASAQISCGSNQHGQVLLRAKRAKFNLFRLKYFTFLPRKFVGLGMTEAEI